MQKRSAGSVADRTASKVRALYPRAHLGGAPASRSEQMSRVKSSGTAIELVLRRALWRMGLRYRVRSRVRGRPDLVFHAARVVLFVDGCFWHSCPIHCRMPRANQQYWREKLSGNAARDLATRDALSAEGWLVLRVWEHELADGVDDVAQRVAAAVRTRGRDRGRRRRRRAAP